MVLRKILIISILILFTSFYINNLTFGQTYKCDLNLLKPVYYKQKNIYVKNLQYCLIELGYKINQKELGYYGFSTVKAVKELYRKNAEEIYKLAKGTNKLWEIKQWSGKKIGNSGIVFIKNKILEKRKITTNKPTLDINSLLALLAQQLKNKISTSGIPTKSSTSTLGTQISSYPITSGGSQVTSNISSNVSGGTSGGGGTSISSGGSGAISGGGTSGGSSSGMPTQTQYKKIGILINGDSDINIKFAKRLDAENFFVVGEIGDKSLLTGKYNITSKLLDAKVYSLTNNIKVNNVLDIGDSLILIGEIENNNISLLVGRLRFDSKFDWLYRYDFANTNFYCIKAFQNVYNAPNLIRVFCTMEDLQTNNNYVFSLLLKITDGSIATEYSVGVNVRLLSASNYLSLKDVVAVGNEYFALIEGVNKEDYSQSLIISKLNQYSGSVSPTKIISATSRLLGYKILKIDNDFYVVGGLNNNNNNTDLVLLQFDSSLNLKLSKIYSDNSLKLINSVIYDNNLIIAGNRKKDLASNPDIIFLSLSKTGNIVGSKIYTSSNGSLVNDLTKDGDYYVLSGNKIETVLRGLIITIDKNGFANFASNANFNISNLSLNTQNLTNLTIKDFNFDSIGTYNPSLFTKTSISLNEITQNLQVYEIINQ
jgi:uncharacterized membrane protein YgcG